MLKIKSEPSRFLLLWPVVLLGLLVGCAYRAHPPARPSVLAPVAPESWDAGMAETDITPPVGYRMAGYFDQRLSTGIHDPLKAKALVLQQCHRRVALVFCDLIGPSLNVSRHARAQASRLTGIPVTNIVIAATHSHTGPLFDDIRRDDFHRQAIARFGRDPHETIDYPAYLTSQIVKAIVEADRQTEPVELDAGRTHQSGLPFNRRFHMKNGRVITNPGVLNSNIISPAGPIDDEVGLLLLKSKKDQHPIGSLTVFAMHADTMSGTAYSADFPFFLQETLRDKFGPQFISAFGAGTCGDLNHINVKQKEKHILQSVAISADLGHRLGETVLAALPALTPVAAPDLAVRSRTLFLPLQDVTPRQVAEGKVIVDRMRDPRINFFVKVDAERNVDLAARGACWPMEIQVIRLNRDTAIVCLPGEIFVELGLAIKAGSPFKNTFVISICNDRPGYVPTKKAFTEGSYEIMNSRVKPGGGEKMVQTALALLHDLQPSAP